MLPPLVDTTAPSSRDKWMWALIGLLIVGQIAAIWLLCQNQVSQAQARHAAWRAENVAVAQQDANAGARADTRAANTLLASDSRVPHRTRVQAD